MYNPFKPLEKHDWANVSETCKNGTTILECLECGEHSTILDVAEDREWMRMEERVGRILGLLLAIIMSIALLAAFAANNARYEGI